MLLRGRAPRMPFPNWQQNIMFAPSARYGVLKPSACGCSMPMGRVSTSPPAHAPVIPQFLRQAAQNGTLVIHGDGNQTRDFVYVDDVVKAMIAAGSAPSVNDTIINIGSGRETSMRELVRLVREVTNSDPEIVYNPHSDGGPARLCADITLAKNKLGYQPAVSLETGLRLTLELDPRLKTR